MPAREGFSAEEARSVGEQIGIDWDSSPFDVDQFRRGMDVELEHGLRDLGTNVWLQSLKFTRVGTSVYYDEGNGGSRRK